MIRRYLVLAQLSIAILLSANPPNMIAVALDAGKTSFTLTNSGPTGGTLSLTFNCILTSQAGAACPDGTSGYTRLGLAISPIFNPGSVNANTTFSACADPCGTGGTASLMSMPREYGQQYFWLVDLQSGGTPVSPFRRSEAAGAYRSRACDGIGTLPQIEPAITTTSPLPMPIEVLGQDCYVIRSRVPLISGHASTGLRLWVVFHASAYNSNVRWDGKLSVKVNSGPWLTYSNNNSALTCDDEMSYYSLATQQPGDQALFATKYKIGGYAQVRVCQMDLADGTIGGSDTTADIAWRFNGTEGQGSGGRILAESIIEADKTVASGSFSVTSNVATGTVTSNGYSTSDEVVLRNCPDMYMAFCGQRTLTGTATNTVSFATCGTGNPACTTPNGTYALPVNTDLSSSPVMTQEVTHIARAIIAKASFTTAAIDSSGPAGGNASTGENYFKTGNDAGTGGQNNQLSSPETPYLNDVFFYATCGGATGCHTFTGRDLKYMNFSNYALIVRTMFHGGTEQQGKNVAAYIRSLPDPVYANARPWSPPYQPGPGLSAGTFTKAASTLTSIVNAGGSPGTATFTVSGTLPPSYITGAPVITSGATVDADLNVMCRITVTGASTFTCPTLNVADGTYTESTLQITMADAFFAGCGWECTLNDGYAQFKRYFAPGGSTASWTFNGSSGRVETRDIPYPWQFPDYKFWLPAVHPADAFPLVDYFASTCYTSQQSFLPGGSAAITAGNFASYKANGYALSMYAACGNTYKSAVATAYGFPGQAHLPDGSAGNIQPSIHPLLFNSISGKILMNTWELWHEQGLIGLYGQMMTDLHGAATATGCYLPWGIPQQQIFNEGAHKFVMAYTGVFDGMRATYDYQSNIWYVAATTIASGNCWGSPNNPLDNAYYNAFLKEIQVYRPGGWASMISAQIISPQAGAQWPDFYYYPTPGAEGQDWTAVWSAVITYEKRFSYYWFTSAEWTEYLNNLLDLILSVTGAHNATYWSTTFTNGGDTNPSPAAAWTLSSGKAGDMTAMLLPMFRMWGADATKLGNYLTWAKSIPAWSGHDFDADYASGIQGDTANGASCSGCSSAGAITVTFTTCPSSAAGAGSVMRYVIDSTGGEQWEMLTPTGGTCTQGGAGTLTFTTTRAHTGTVSVTWGCGVGKKQNYNFGNPTGTPPWWMCGNVASAF